MKKIIFTLVYLLFVFLSLEAKAFNYCANNGNSSATAITETSDCYAQPDVQKVTFYRIALCTTQPTAPTASTPVGTNSCVDIFKNSSGSNLTVQNKVTTNLTGNTAIDSDGRLNLPAGNYSYVYVEVDPTFQQQKVAYFSSTRQNTNSTSSGVKCWSLPVTTYGYNSSNPTATTCGASGATTTGLGLTTVVNNTLNGSAGFVSSASFSCDAPASTITAYLIQSSGVLGTAPQDNLGTVSKIAAFTALQSPFTVTKLKQKSISKLDLGFLNSYGTSVSQWTGGGVTQVGVFSGGPLCIYLRSYSSN